MMSGVELISEIAGKIAWPVCLTGFFIFLAYMLRDSLEELMDALVKFIGRTKQIKINKKQGVIIISQRLANSETFRRRIAMVDQPIIPKFMPKMEKVRMMAEMNPAKAIKEVWGVLSIHDPERKMPGVRITETNPDEQGLFDNLKGVYETASATPFAATPEQAIKYAELGLQFASVAESKNNMEA